MKNMKTQASEWVNTDKAAVTKDVERLGIEGAVEYQMELIQDRTEAGDSRWAGVTEEEMRAAILEIVRA